MKILKEDKFYPFTADSADENVALARLEDGTIILIRENGTAAGSDGRKYVRVCREVEVLHGVNCLSYLDDEPDAFIDTELEEIGWTADADETVIEHVCAEQTNDNKAKILPHS